MKNYYLSDIVGSGQIGDPFRTKVDDACEAWNAAHPDQALNRSALIPTGADGKPTSSFALVIVGGPTHAALQGVPGIDAGPQFANAVRLSAMGNVMLVALKAALARRGLDPSSWPTSEAYSQWIDRIGQSLDAAFSSANFDAPG